MAPPRVVEPLDVVEYIGAGGIAGAVDLASSPLGLQRREEALHRRAVSDVASPAHQADDSVIEDQALELLTSVLPPLSEWCSSALA